MSSAKVLALAIAAAALSAGVIWQAALREDRENVLKVAFLDVGQGDSIYIESPTGVQALIDGGPDATVLRRLGALMPWYDRSLDLVVGTHPDADHVAGLIDVLSRYKVGTVMQSSVLGSTQTWDAFEKSAKKERARFLVAQRGEVVDLGAGAYLEVLSPDRSVPHVETNTGCVVLRLVYGQTSFMLPCDAPQGIENYLVELDGSRLKSDVLKPGHHGSKTASSPLFVGEVDPSYAVFSRGCGNKYGFPHAATVETLRKFGISIEDTCAQGTIVFQSDGRRVRLR